jgi:Domain of unknown function (DUF4157)
MGNPIPIQGCVSRFAPPKARPKTHSAARAIGCQAHRAADQKPVPWRGVKPAVSLDFGKIRVSAPNQASRTRASSLIKEPGIVIGRVDDPLEYEANRIAEHVMRKPGSQPCIAAAQAQFSPKCAAGEEEHVQRLQTKPAEMSVAGGGNAPEVVHEVLRSPGRPLNNSTRGFMESRFGHDFSQVRVHTDSRAAESARSVNAAAYTVGRDVVFGAGQYAPTSDAGRKLLAHELVHTIQQRESATASLPVAGRSEHEREGDAAAGDPSERPIPVLKALHSRVVARQQLNPDEPPKIEHDIEVEPRLVPMDAPAVREVAKEEARPPTEAEEAANARLRALAARPSQALRQWNRLKPAERSFVVMVMTGRYGVDFAQDFLNYAQRRKRPDLSTEVTNRATPASLTARGLRYAGDPGGTPLWVHPSGHEVMLMSRSKLAPPEEPSVERPPEEVERCRQTCADTDDEDSCLACCEERITGTSDDDIRCRRNCADFCQTRL